MKADTATEAEVLNTLEKFNKAFAKKNVDDVLRLFALDSDLVFMGSEAGETALGRDELKALLVRVFSRHETYSWEWKWRTVSAASSVAWLAAEALVSAKVDAEKVSLPYRMTVVLEKRDGRWYWMQYHSSEPAGGQT